MVAATGFASLPLRVALMSPFENFVREIAVLLLDVAVGDLEKAMNAVMGSIGKRYEVDRVQLRWIAEDQRLAPAMASWARRPNMGIGTYPLDEIRWLAAQTRAGIPVHVDSLDDLPDEAASDRQALESRDVAALLLSPLTINKEIIGALALSTYERFHWSDTIRTEVASLAPIIAGAYWAAISRASLEETEARYRAVVQDQTEMISRWKPDGTTTWVNDACCRNVGMSREELIGTKEYKFLTDEEWSKLQDKISKLTPQSPTYIGEYQITLASGDTIWQEWTDRGIFDDVGQLTEIQSVGRDITARKSAEDAVVRSAEFQRHKADLLIGLTSLSLEDADSIIGQSLEKIAGLYDAARIFVWLFSEKDASYTWQYRWLEPGAKPSPATTGTVGVAETQWLSDKMRAGETVVINRANDLPPEADQNRRLLELIGCETFIGFPLIVDGVNFGICSFAATRAYAWDDLAIDEMEVLSNTLATVISRFRTSEELARHAAFQSRLSSVSSRLLGAEVDQIDVVIAEILSEIGIDYGLDRVNLTWYDKRLLRFSEPFGWARDENPIRQVSSGEMPWSTELTLRGNVVPIDDINEMPEEAAADRDLLDELGYSSALGVPLLFGDTVIGAASFANRERRAWSDDADKIQELQLIAGALTNAAVRQWASAEIVQREKDLARSQQVAEVGSFKVTAMLGADGAVQFPSVSISEQGLKIFSVEEGSELVSAIISRIHPDDIQRNRETWRKTIKNGTNHEMQYRIVRPDGSITHVQSRADVDYVDAGGVSTVFGTYKDVTEWVESNRELQSALSEIEALKDQLQRENVLLREEVKAAHGFDTIIGESQSLREVLQSAEQVAPTDVTVLVTGETGTGKELIARSIHELSDRKDNVMVCLNCAALSAELIESELFGHEKGAFTGAHEKRKGRFELADGGTLFLDEIGEMSSYTQAKLLRVLQEGEFERLGGSETLKTDVRIIAATNRDLQRAVDDGEFRADLYYRIGSFPLHIPPLRERKDDIPLLAEHLAQKHAKTMGKEINSISARTLRSFRNQRWPGNIRELEGTIMRALITTPGPVLDYSGEFPETDLPAAANLLDAQRVHIRKILDQTNWVIDGKNGAAVALGLAPSTLRSKMKRLDIVRPPEI